MRVAGAASSAVVGQLITKERVPLTDGDGYTSGELNEV
jgi:hypothetical protein